MEELQDALEDAQYVNAINLDEGPRPITAWEKPSDEEMEKWKNNLVKKWNDSSNKSTEPEPFSYDWVLAFPLGFYMFSSFIKQNSDDYVQVNFIEEILRWRYLRGKSRGSKIRKIYDRYLMPGDIDEETKERKKPKLYHIDENYLEHICSGRKIPREELSQLLTKHTDDTCCKNTIGIDGPFYDEVMKKIHDCLEDDVSTLATDDVSTYSSYSSQDSTADIDADADADADDNSTTATVLYSADGGSSWLPVAGGIQGEEYVVNSATLTGSEQALFRVLVTDGMHTAQDDSDFVFTVAEKAPTVSIVTPSADGQVSSAEPVILRGAARDAAGVELSGDSFVWELNGEPIAVGNSISAALPPGEQQLSLVVTADNGMSEQVSVILNVAGSDSDGDGIADENDSCPDSLPGSVVIVADCPTQVENFLYNNGCSLEELVNTALNQGGRQGLIEMLQAMRKRGELDHQDQKVIKRCVREDD
jgi:hypothetical protein